jgi:hypothetical protein
MKSSPEFDERLEKLVAIANQIVEEYHKKAGYTFDRDCIKALPGSRYIKLIQESATGSRSVYGFVDKSNGDIYKAASWKMPAKHPRGNLFNTDLGRGCLNPFGINYLK